MKSFFSRVSSKLGLAAVLCLVLWAATWQGHVAKAASPAPSQTLFTDQTPTEPNDTDGVSYELGTKFKTLAQGRISAIRYWRASSETDVPCDGCGYTHTGRIWSSDGTVLAVAHFTNESSEGWQQADLDSPIAVDGNKVYVVTVDVASYYVATTGGLNSAITNGKLTTVADGSNGVYGPIGSFPTQSYENSNYFRDVVFTKEITINSGGPAVGSFNGDRFVGGGEGGSVGLTASTTNSIGNSGDSDPAPEAVYQTCRYATGSFFVYTIAGLDADGTNTITNGAPYRVRLHFADFQNTQVGQREFNVYINGQQVLSNFDIIAPGAAGAPNTGDIETFDVTATNYQGVGAIVIQFVNGAAGLRSEE